MSHLLRACSVKYMVKMKTTEVVIINLYRANMGRVGALVESIPFSRRVVCSNPALNSQLPVALRRETPAQYSCCVGSAAE